jgi:predicted RNase H-like HicB family nuclease
MSVYHIRFTFDDDWYFIQAVEDEKIYSQARTLDEAVLMIRDLLDVLKGEKDAELRLVIPHDLPVDDLRQSGRITHPVDAEEDVLPSKTLPPPKKRAAS